MPAVIPIVAAVAGAAISSNGAKSAANTQADAARAAADTQANAMQSANATQLQMYNQTRDDQAPWRQAGGQAVDALSQWYGLGGGSMDYNAMLQNMPGYQFQVDQGNQNVQKNLAARGLLSSGAAGKALTQYGQGVASGYADKYVNGLQSLAGLGQSSAQATGQAGVNAANGATAATMSGAAGVGNAMAYGANAQAAGQAGQANAWANGLTGLAGIYGQYQSQQQMQQPQPIDTSRYNDMYQLSPYTPTAQRYGLN